MYHRFTFDTAMEIAGIERAVVGKKQNVLEKALQSARCPAIVGTMVNSMKP